MGSGRTKDRLLRDAALSIKAALLHDWGIARRSNPVHDGKHFSPSAKCFTTFRSAEIATGVGILAVVLETGEIMYASKVFATT